MAKRACADNAPKPFELAPGVSYDVPAPILDGFGSACWKWSRQFQCVETDPVYSCESGTPYETVKANCNLTGASINATTTINGLQYITDATYTYRCEYGSWNPSKDLPAGKECVLLDSSVVDTDSTAAAPTGTTVSSGVGTPPTTTPLNTSITTDQEQTNKYVCYAPEITVCSDKCYESKANAVTGKLEQVEVPCSAPVSTCVTSNDQCTGTVTTDANGNQVATRNIGPDGRCIERDTEQICQTGDIPKCLSNDQCTLQSTKPADVQDNGVSYSQEQTYICSNETTTCTKQTSVSNCVHATAWGWDNQGIEGESGQGLGELNQALAKVDAIQKGMNKQDPYIFSGQDRRCHYPVGNFLNTFIIVAMIAVTMIATGGATTGLISTALQSVAGPAASGALAGTLTLAQCNMIGAAISAGSTFISDAVNSKALGNDCCKDYVIEGSDAWFRFGSCSIDEVKLAVARRKGLYHYIGTYCSKKGGFPIRQCVEKTKTYCTFDDMLALTVNEQGRAQLDAIASADPTTTKSTPEAVWPLYSPEVANPVKYTGMDNGQWVLRNTFNNSQIWTWQYPGYCQSQEKQAAAYALYQAEVNAALDQKGIKPESMTKEEAVRMIAEMANLPAFQECPESAGRVAALTCSKADDSCDVTKLPEGPTGVETDFTGEDVSQADLNWRISEFSAFHLPGDYGVTATMPGNPAFAAVSSSVNEYITAIGSCHTDGECMYRFAVTDKQANGLGARKRTSDSVQFPLYTLVNNSAWPTVNYLSADGTLDTAAYMADVNRGRGSPLTIGGQSFVFHPNHVSTAPNGTIHNSVLMEWATGIDNVAPADSYAPVLVPTSLPLATDGWYPKGDPADNKKHFYLTGGCDPNSRWCDYTVEVDLNVPRHPWGSAKNPRCWGFTVEQLAALDFDKMDLSKWVASLNLDSVANGLSADAAKAMTEQATTSAQSFYSAFKSGSATQTPVAGTIALVTNTDTLPMLSSDEYGTYVLHIGVPSNWPAWYSTGLNNNPVTNVWVDWGDGNVKQAVPLNANGKMYDITHDYGGRLPGTYKITVTLDTAANGSQTMTTNVHITPDKGETPKPTSIDFNSPGINGNSQTTYTPSMMNNGASQAPADLEQLAPAMTDMFEKQGDSVTPTTTP